MKSAEMDERDAQVIIALCERVGVSAVLRAMADRCASEATGSGPSTTIWEAAYHLVTKADELVRALERQDPSR